MTDMEESPLLTVFGDDPFIKIVDTLLDHPNYGYTKKELAEVNGIAWKTVNKRWKRLEALNLIEEGRTISNTTLYRLNSESKVTEAFIKFEKMVREADIQ